MGIMVTDPMVELANRRTAHYLQIDLLRVSGGDQASLR